MVPWFTSDTHWGHANVIRYDNRPFASIQDHDEALIENWNRVVSPGDVVYHLGDVAWHRRELDVDVLLSLLNGTKILIVGNHDRTNKALLRSKHWAKVCDYHEITHKGQRVVLFHYPCESWVAKSHGSWHLHGHCHGHVPSVGIYRLDVGTMLHGYTPINFAQVAAHMGTINVDKHKMVDEDVWA